VLQVLLILQGESLVNRLRSSSLQSSLCPCLITRMALSLCSAGALLRYFRKSANCSGQGLWAPTAQLAFKPLKKPLLSGLLCLLCHVSGRHGRACPAYRLWSGAQSSGPYCPSVLTPLPLKLQISQTQCRAQTSNQTCHYIIAYAQLDMHSLQARIQRDNLLPRLPLPQSQKAHDIVQQT